MLSCDGGFMCTVAATYRIRAVDPMASTRPTTRARAAPATSSLFTGAAGAAAAEQIIATVEQEADELAKAEADARAMIGASVDVLDTPALMIDLDAVEANIKGKPSSAFEPNSIGPPRSLVGCR